VNESEIRVVAEITVRRARRGRVTAWLAICDSCGPLQTGIGRKPLALAAAEEHAAVQHPYTARLRVQN
jgi:hypothetical protein